MHHIIFQDIPIIQLFKTDAIKQTNIHEKLNVKKKKKMLNSIFFFRSIHVLHNFRILFLKKKKKKSTNSL